MSQIPPEELARIESWKKKVTEIKGKRSTDIRYASAKLLKSGGYEPFEVRLSASAPGIDSAEEYERGYYGIHLGRVWKVGEVAQIEGNPLFQRWQKSIMPIIMTKPDGTQIATPNKDPVDFSEKDYEMFAEFKAEMILKTFDPAMGITKEMLLNDALYMNFMWLRLQEESGMGTGMGKDLKSFFRGRESLGFAISDNRKTGTQ